MTAKYHHGLIFISGMGAHVKKTVSSRKDLRPHTSDSAPIRGALRKDNRPFTPWISPFIRNVCWGNVWCNTVSIGVVRRPHAKNSKKMTTTAWYTLGSPIPWGLPPSFIIIFFARRMLRFSRFFFFFSPVIVNLCPFLMSKGHRSAYPRWINVVIWTAGPSHSSSEQLAGSAN